MSPVAPQRLSDRGNIIVVDDNPANLKLMEKMLREHGYEVRSFPRGRLALAAAENEPPDLILLDINMPEMDGYEVCAKLKASAHLSGVPVIFLSALNAIEDKIKGFQSGGVDYISKPFRFEEVRARVDTHLKLRRAQQAEHDLLENTLGGIVRTLWELMHISSPLLALRSGAVRDIVLRITRQMGTSDPWQYDLAATLCLVGCIVLPEEIFQKAYCGETLSLDEERMFNAHPERGASLLSNIPRLELVAGMIRNQHNPESEASGNEQVKQGASMLQLALQLDRRIYRGVAPSAALAELGRHFDSGMVEALRGYAPAKPVYDLRRVPIRELRAGMILEHDFCSDEGKVLIFKAGTALTDIWIERIGNFAKGGAQELIDVHVPRPIDLRG
jgi:CheY-like chemotaxis protein